MSKLVDKERLAKLAQALDSRMKAAVKAEEDRAKLAEQAVDAKAVANAEAIAAINNAETGILKQAKDYADAIDTDLQRQIDNKVEVEAYNAQVKTLTDADAEFAEDIAGLDAAVQGLKTQMGDGNFGALDSAITEATEELRAKDAELQTAVEKAQGEVDAVELRADALEQKVGQDAAEGQPATGLFAEVDKVASDLALEVQRAQGAEVANTNAINALDGRMDQAEADIDALQAKFEGDDSIENQIAAVQANVEQHYEDEAEENQKLQEAINQKVAQADYDAKVQALELADSGLGTRIAVFEGDENKAGSVKNQIKVAVNAIDGEMTELEGRVKANEDKLAGLENATVKAEIEAAQAAAEKHADDAITALVDSAPEAMNTLNELAQAIKDHGDVYTAFVETVAGDIATAKQEAINAAAQDAAGKDTALKSELQAEIDADVKAEADRAKAEEADIRADFAAADAALHTTISAEIDADVKVEKERAEGVEADLQAAIDVLNGADSVEGSVAKAVKDAVGVENQRALAQEAAIRNEFAAADQGLSQRLSSVENLIGVGGEGQQNALQVLQGEIDAIEEEVADLKEEDLRLAGEIANKVAQADYDNKVQDLEDADAALANRIKVFEANGDLDVAALKARVDEAEGDIDDLEAFVAGHDHDQMIADIAANAKAITDNRKACQDEMAQEVLDRNAAIEEALKDYADKEELKVILGNVVNSLALTMEDNKMILKLGGVEGVAIHEVSLDMATDADIDAIIAGLDAE